MTSGTLISAPDGNRLYLDANVIISLMQYSWAYSQGVIDNWTAQSKSRCENMISLLAAGAFRMQQARAGAVQESSGPRLFTSIFSLAQGSRALQLYSVLSRRIADQVPYRDLTKFSDVDEGIIPEDLTNAELAVEYFIEEWLKEMNFRDAIVMGSFEDHSQIDGGIFGIARQFNRFTYLDPEDALHLASAVVIGCTHFATLDNPLRRALQKLRENQQFQQWLSATSPGFPLPQTINPTNIACIDALSWSSPATPDS